MKKTEERLGRTVQPFARFTAGEVKLIRERITREFIRSIDGKEAEIALGGKLRDVEYAALAQLFKQAGVGLETVDLDELPANRAERRRLLRELDHPAVRAERRGRYGMWKRRQIRGRR